MSDDVKKNQHAHKLAVEYGLSTNPELKYDDFYTDYPHWWLKLASKHNGIGVLVKFNPDEFT